MLNVQLIKSSNFEGFTMIQEAVEQKGVQNVLVITDSMDTQRQWESKNVRVELVNSINDKSINEQLCPKYKNVDTIFITSPKMIARWYTETVNVKVSKAKELFHAFNSDIYILSPYVNAASVVSNSERTDSRSVEQERVRKVQTSSIRRFARVR